MEWSDSRYDTFMERLRDLRSWPDPHDAEMHDRIIATGKKTLLIRTPDIRAEVRAIWNEDRRDDNGSVSSFLATAVNRGCFDTFETSLVYGLTAARTRDFARYKERITPFIERCDTWAETDVVAGDSALFKKLTPEMTDWIFGLTEREKEPFVIRFGLILMMKYLKENDFLPQVLRCCLTVPKENYYVRMGVAWLLAEYFVSFPEEIYGFLAQDRKIITATSQADDKSAGRTGDHFGYSAGDKADSRTVIDKDGRSERSASTSHRLDTWTHDKAIQKACESFRISDGEKQALRNLRIGKRDTDNRAKTAPAVKAPINLKTGRKDKGCK